MISDAASWRPMGLSPGLEARRLGRLRWVACHHSLAAIPIYHAPRPASRACDGAIRAFRGSTSLTIVEAVAKRYRTGSHLGCPTKSRCGNRKRGNLAATLEQTRHRTCPSNPLTSLSFCRRKAQARRAENDVRYVWPIAELKTALASLSKRHVEAGYPSPLVASACWPIATGSVGRA